MLLGTMKFDLDLLRDIEFSAEGGSKILEAMKRVYPNATEKELLEGKENLQNYLKLALRISMRVLREEESRRFDSGQKTSYDDRKVESNLNI